MLISSSALTLRAQDSTTAPLTPPSDSDPAAHQGYQPERYEELWTKSPFAVETPDDAVATDTADYSLVGVAQLGGVTYASLIQKQNGAHLFVSSDKPLGGLSLNSISNKPDGIYAMLTRDGQPLTLKLETATAGVPTAPGQPMGMAQPNMPGGFNAPAPTVPGVTTQNIPMPGAFNPATARPMIRIRRPIIHVPPRVPGQPTPPPGAPPGQ